MSLTHADTPLYVRHTYPDGHLGWFVLDYKLSKKLLADPRFSGHPLRSLTDDGGFQEAMSGRNAPVIWRGSIHRTTPAFARRRPGISQSSASASSAR